MAQPPLFDVLVKDARLEAAHQVLLTVDAQKTAVVQTHHQPGQYAFVQLFDDAKAYPIALANPPGESAIELLVKVAPEAIETTLALKGQAIKMSEATGPGYPLSGAQGRDLLLVAVGSAIAPIRATLLEALKTPKAFSAITLVYGVREENGFAFLDDIHAAEKVPTTVIRTVSGPAEAWRGQKGRVQLHLERVVPRPAMTTAFVCGMGAMQNEVKARLIELGISPDSIYFNY